MSEGRKFSTLKYFRNVAAMVVAGGMSSASEGNSMNYANAFHLGSGGYKTLPTDWVSPSSLRGLLYEDPCSVWLQHHGEKHGFHKDPEENSMLSWLGEQGGKFESEWVRRMAPEAIQANDADFDVRRIGVRSFLKTLDAMARSKDGVITKGALWYAPSKCYGTTDILCRTSWLRKNLPALRPLLEDEPEHWIVCDCKMKSRLDDPSHATALKTDSTQVRIYSHILGSLQGSMPRYAFLITRDRVTDPLPVEVGYQLGDPLDIETRGYIDLHNRIKREGATLFPWKDDLVRISPYDLTEPWSEAKKIILADRMPSRGLYNIPYVGRQAEEVLNNLGFQSVEDLISAGPQALREANVPGFGEKRLGRVEAVLAANADNPDPVNIPKEIIPEKHHQEFLIDLEFFPPIQPDYSKWPDLPGHGEMVFLIGIGTTNKDGDWEFHRFVAKKATPAAERLMWHQFLRFLHSRGVLCGPVNNSAFNTDADSTFYSWSSAEKTQFRRTAKRLDLPILTELPLVDLQRCFLDGPIALPTAFDFGLKTTIKALGKMSPEHAVEYPPELSSGGSAMVMGLKAYEQDVPQETSEMKSIIDYLEIDVKSLWQILRWLRTFDCERSDPLPRGIQGHTATAYNIGHWYRGSLGILLKSQAPKLIRRSDKQICSPAYSLQ